MRDDGENEPIEPNLVANIFIPVIGKVIVFFQCVRISQQQAIFGKEHSHKLLERNSKYIGLQEKGDQNCCANVGHHQIGHNICGQFCMVFVSLELGDCYHNLFQNLLEDNDQHRNSNSYRDLLVVKTDVLVAKVDFLLCVQIIIDAPRKQNWDFSHILESFEVVVDI